MINLVKTKSLLKSMNLGMLLGAFLFIILITLHSLNLYQKVAILLLSTLLLPIVIMLLYP